MMPRTGVPKTFSTTARIHPNIRHVHPGSSRMPRARGNRRWFFPSLALFALGAAITADQVSQARHHQTQQSMAVQEARRKREKALLDAYGTKETLEDLEAALEYYEVQ